MHQFNEHHEELKGFSEYYHEKIHPLLDGRDGERLQARANFKKACIGWVILAVIIAAIAIPIKGTSEPLLPIGFGLAGVIFLTHRFVFNSVEDFTKQKIVGGICDYVGWTFEAKTPHAPDFRDWAELGLIPRGYKAPSAMNFEASKVWDNVLNSKSISEAKQNLSGFKTLWKDRQSINSDRRSIRDHAADLESTLGSKSSAVEDRISGCAHGADFSSIEAKLTRSSGKRTVVDFHGQLIAMTFPRKFLGKTVVLRDAGRFQKKKMNDMKRVGLVDPVFEDVFEAYGTDQVEARYLLDPVFMEKFLELEKSVLGNNIRFGFANSQLLIAVETGDRFEAGSMRHSLMDTNRTQRILNEIGAIYDVVDGVMKPAERRV